MSKITALAFGLACWWSSTLVAGDWTHWRGENGNGVSTTATPPTEWSATKNVRWKLAIPGRSSGSPVVDGDRVFVVTAVPTGDGAQAPEVEPANESDGRGRRGRRPAQPLEPLAFQVWCIDRQTGEPLWKRTAVEATPHQQTHATNSHASASPTTDGQRVYAHFGSRGLYCYDFEGNLQWKRDDFPPMKTRMGFGEGSSPVLEGDTIVLPWDHEGQSWLYALDKHRGETIWKVRRDEPTEWATPLVVEQDGKKQIIMNGENYARAYDFERGAELWRCGGQTSRPAASPVAADGLVYVGSGFRGAYLGAFRLDGEGDLRGTDHVVWTVGRDTPDIPSLLLSDGRLYYFKGRTGILTCLDAATGQALFGPTRTPGLENIYASPIAAGGHVYLTDREGTTVVIRDADEFEVVGTNSVGETVDATPAPVDNQLFIRGEQHLFCIEE